jgi:hypothetical protein
MTNRDGADIQEAKKYVTSKHSNISNAGNSMSNSTGSTSGQLGNLSSSTVSSSRPMGATIQEAAQYNQQQGGSSGFASSSTAGFSSSTSVGNIGSNDLSSGAIQQEIKEAKKVTTNPSSGSMQ